MEDKYLYILRDRDGDICGMKEGSDECVCISTAARLFKDKVDYHRQLEGEHPAECCEVWLRDQPYRLHLLATFF